MLPFFRKIRWRLAADNQFFKYSRYAVGEIVLVVIGILIALYINNWNEERKDQERFDQILLEVEKELVLNIKEARNTFNIYNSKDSLVGAILFDSLTLEDFKRDSNKLLAYVPNTYIEFIIDDDAYTKLTSISENTTTEQDSIIKELGRIYTVTKDFIDISNKQIADQVVLVNNSYDDKDWYPNWVIDVNEDAAYKYFAFNPRFKNHVIHYYGYAEDLRGFLEEFDVGAVNAYRAIHDYLSEGSLKDTDSLLFEYEAQRFEHYVGTYVPYWANPKTESDSMTITLEQDKLFYERHWPDGRKNKREIIPIDKYHFRTVLGYGYYYLRFDKKGNVIGHEFSGGGLRIKEKKVR